MMHLKENAITELPEFFFDELTFLEWFDIRDNKLTTLPALNSKHTALRVLLLQGNKIRALPYSLGMNMNKPFNSRPSSLRENIFYFLVTGVFQVLQKT